MKVKEMLEQLQLQLLTKDVSQDALYAEVEGGYASDLLSNAMGQAQPGMVWVTMQGHQNVAAVASLIGLSCVVVAGDGPVAQETLHKAQMNDIVIAATKKPAFELIGELYALGVGKK
jgi:hypothetical protein